MFLSVLFHNIRLLRYSLGGTADVGRTGKSNPVKHKMPQKLISALALIVLSWPYSVLSQTQKKDVSVEAYIKKQLNEQVYLHTDRDVYAPGDTIWFKAYVRNKLNLRKTNLSRILHVFLVSKDSVVYQWEKCLIQDSQSKGYIAIGDSQTEDICHIIAFSSWMNNFEPDCFFSKKIVIREDFSKIQKYTPFFNKPGYFQGDTVKIRMDYLRSIKQEDIAKDLVFLFRADKRTDLKINPSRYDLSKPITWALPESDVKDYQFRITDYNDFDKTIDIPFRSKINVRFFPEGGNFINGLSTVIAFKATYDNGQPATITGELVNKEGSVFTQIKTEHEGMGRFMMMPVKGETYYLKLKTPEQCKELIEIPEANESGWVLNARVSNRNIIADIRNSFTQADTCYLTLSVHGIFYSFQKVPILSQAVTPISTSDLPAGIGVLTLLDKSHNPVAERLVFVNYNSYLLADVLPGKEKSAKMDSMSIKIKVNNEHYALAKGQFSLSVYDDELGSSAELDEPNIIASTYFNNELKGHIHHPNYYFNSETRKAQSHLDLLLMVQGWRKYHYINQLYNDSTSYQPVSQDLISGNLQKLKFGKGLVEIPGEINVYFAGNSSKIQVGDNGKFSFYPEYSKNSSSSITITGYDKKGNSNVNVSTNANRFKSNLVTYLNENPLNGDNSPPFIYTFKEINDPFKINLDQNIWIQELKVTGTKRPIDIEQRVAENLSNQRKAPDDVLVTSHSIYDLIMNMGYNCEIDYTTEFETLNVMYMGAPTSIVFEVDGIRYDYYMINDLNPANFEYFYVVMGIDAELIYGGSVAAIIKMKKNSNVRSDSFVKNPVKISRPQLYKEFYNPKYDKDKNLSIPDLRKTIYWNPTVKTDENGEALVTFYNAQRITKIKCVVQGMTEEGIPVYGEAFYKVVRDQEIDF